RRCSSTTTPSETSRPASRARSRRGSAPRPITTRSPPTAVPSSRVTPTSASSCTVTCSARWPGSSSTPWSVKSFWYRSAMLGGNWEAPTTSSGNTRVTWAPFCDSAAASSAPMKDRKSTRLNSSHVSISYAVFCLKKNTVSEQRQTSADIEKYRLSSRPEQKGTRQNKQLSTATTYTNTVGTNRHKQCDRRTCNVFE